MGEKFKEFNSEEACEEDGNPEKEIKKCPLEIFIPVTDGIFDENGNQKW